MPPISRPASSTYWTPPSNRQRRLSEIPSSSSKNYSALSRTGDRNFGRPGDDSSTATSRNYVDPWDLENYAFMRRHCTTDAETEYVVTSTPALESSQSDFYYVPQPPPPQHEEYIPRDDSIGLVNGVEEEDFYNERYELYSRYSPRNLCRQQFKPGSCLHSRTDTGDSYEDYDVYGEDSGAIYSDDSTGVYNPRLDCQLYSPSVMLRRAPSHQSEQSLVYVYETGSRKRKMALPKSNLCNTPAPPMRRNSTNSHHISENYRLVL
ncbi:hypothetical protein L9F63_017173 [Diploptera punctata]|uniref:Uncharacterized protein n=1 Tax=Diploptera punctata TaxID=6984 RepID=A0AAD8EGL3_DIPPU|nr:hypothetical protein L9F63_017173 [Diploptera punctata]